MNSTTLGLIIFLSTLLIYAICLIFRRQFQLSSRPKKRAAIETLRRSLTRQFEDGEPVHLDVSNANEASSIGISSLVALASAEKLANRFAGADEPLRVTSNSGTAHALLKEAVLNGIAAAELENEYDPENVEFAGYDRLSHQSTMLSVLEASDATLHLNVGTPGAAVALQDLMFHEDEAILVAGDDLTAQAAGLAMADVVYVGEQLYELPGDLKPGGESDPVETGLLVMDVLRYGFIFALIAGALMIFLS